MTRFRLTLMIAFSLFIRGQAAGFEPFSEPEKKAYRFQLERNLFADAGCWKNACDQARKIADEIEGYRAKTTLSARSLLGAMDAYRRLTDLLYRLSAYASFKKAVNTDDRAAFEAQEQLEAEIGARTSFLRVELKKLNPRLLDDFIRQEPVLEKFRYFLQDIVRMAPHTLSEDKESVLSAVSPDLTSWQADLFQKVFDRAAFPKIRADGKEYDVHLDFEALMMNPDRRIRERAFRDYYSTLKRDADLLGFALRQEMRTLNSVARMRGFETYFHQALFEMYLSRPEMDSLFNQIEGAIPLYRAYQKVRMDSLKVELSIPETCFWDMQIPPKGTPVPRFAVATGTRILRESLGVLGASYSVDLARMLDPANGKLDVVGGRKREQGGFCIGNFGYFMDGYQGYLKDLSAMAHEVGHEMQSQLVQQKCGSLLFEDGPAFMTESFAMFNEWLLREHLMKTASDPATRKGMAWDSLNEMMYLWELARRAKFEMVCYDRVSRDEIADYKGFNKTCLEVGKVYDILFPRHPELEYHWIRKHHYWTDPTYYVNYVISHALALKYLEMYRADPAGFTTKYIDMIATGFDRPADGLLKDFLGIDLKDPALLEGVFKMIRSRFDEFMAGVK